jgi:hypothetical protein
MTAPPQTPAALVASARTALAHALGKSKPVSAAALGRALGYVARDPGRNVKSWLTGETDIPPPAALALQFMASGAPLPSFVLARVSGGRKAAPLATPATIVAPPKPQQPELDPHSPFAPIHPLENEFRGRTPKDWFYKDNAAFGGLSPLRYLHAQRHDPDGGNTVIRSYIVSTFHGS